MIETKLDIIGIGAINFDFMFNFNEKNEIETPGGFEELFGANSEEDVKKKISLAMNLQTPCSIQLGGAAFGTIRSAYGGSASNEHIENDLRLGYVGVYGKMQEPYLSQLIRMGCYDINKSIRKSFDFLTDEGRAFLFEDDGQNGIGYFAISSGGVRLNFDSWFYNSQIFQGVNKNLYEKIQEREKELGLDFSDYLAGAKWIHISSLVEFEQFMFIIEKIRQAKLKNPDLKISMDPGSSYMKNKVEFLKPAFSICDFVFLSGFEFQSFQDILSYQDKPDVISILVKQHFGEMVNCCFIANTKKGTYRVIRVKGSRVFVNNIHYNSYKSINDTGSGSSFAGGFIFANINPNAHLESSIASGNITEGMRLISNGSPYETVDLKTGEEIDLRKELKKIKADLEKNMKKKKVFISHSSKDSPVIDRFLTMLSSVGIDNQHIFCSSIYGYEIKGIGKEVKFHECLKKELAEENALVLFMLSVNFFHNKYSLFELGATWALDRDWHAIIMPGYSYSKLPKSLPIEIDDAIGIDLNLAGKDKNNYKILADKLDYLLNVFITHLSLPQPNKVTWERARDNFLDTI